MMKSVYLPLMLMLITVSEVHAWTKYGGDASCKTILANDNDTLLPHTPRSGDSSTYSPCSIALVTPSPFFAYSLQNPDLTTSPVTLM